MIMFSIRMVIFDIFSFLCLVVFLWNMLVYKLCDIVDVFVSVRLVIIVRMVVNVIVEIKLRNRLLFIVLVRCIVVMLLLLISVFVVFL